MRMRLPKVAQLAQRVISISGYIMDLSLQMMRKYRSHWGTFSPFGSGSGLVAYSEAQSSGVPVATEASEANKKKRVVVLGTGWAATSFLKNLKDPSYDVQVILPRNYFAFTPLLPSVTCGTVESRSVVEPVRNIIRKKGVDMNYLKAECFKIDAANKKVHCRSNLSNNLNGEEEFVVDYDYLVVSQ